jgi:hypothetical protein
MGTLLSEKLGNSFSIMVYMVYYVYMFCTGFTWKRQPTGPEIPPQGGPSDRWNIQQITVSCDPVRSVLTEKSERTAETDIYKEVGL